MKIFMLEKELLYSPVGVLGWYAICFTFAFWRCQSAWVKTLTLAFAISRLPLIVMIIAWPFMVASVFKSSVDPFTVAYAMADALFYSAMAITPYVLAQPRLRAKVARPFRPLITPINAAAQSLRELLAHGQQLLLRLLPHLRSTALSNADLAKRSTTSTVAALMKLEEQRRVARSERLATAEQVEPKSDLDKLIAKYGTYKPGMVAVIVPGPDGQQVLLWMPPPRQRTSNLHLWFNVLKTAGMAGIVLYFFLQLPSWLQPVAGVGIAGVGLLSYLHFNPLHFFGFGH